MLRRTFSTAVLVGFAALLIGSLFIATRNPASELKPMPLKQIPRNQPADSANKSTYTSPQEKFRAGVVAPAPATADTIPAAAAGEPAHDCPCPGECGAAEQYRQQEH